MQIKINIVKFISLESIKESYIILQHRTHYLENLGPKAFWILSTLAKKKK
jgi:hypothetical protein